MLPAYSRRFDTVEVDSAFSRPPTDQSVQRWAEQTPDDFRFSVRVPREITHAEEGLDFSGLGDLLSTLDGLGPRLGSLLFTLPTIQFFDPALIERVSGLVDGRCLVAWQVKHPTWFSASAVRHVSQSNSTLAVVDDLDSPVGEDLLAEEELPALYVRFRRPNYTVSDIISWGESIAESSDSRNVFAFFKPSRDASAYAIGLLDCLGV